MFKDKKIVIPGIILIVLSVCYYSTNQERVLPEYNYHIEDNSGFDSIVYEGPFNNVFTGKIIRQVGDEDSYFQTITAAERTERELDGRKSTKIGAKQYEVEVVNNIKGELTGKVVVNVRGGCDKSKNNCVAMIGGMDGTVLPNGRTYIFPTRYDMENNWHTVTAPLQSPK